MVTQSDQPRPDLDAAIDAVVPSLTAVSDEVAAASLRRTRLALAAGPDARRAFAWGWAFAATATAGVIVLVSVNLWRRPAPAPGSIVEQRPANPAVVTSPPASSAPSTVAAIVVPPRVIRPARRARAPHVEATSAPPVDEAPRPDPLIALVRAVQQIPEDAWQASAARNEGPVIVPEVSIPPIVVPSIDATPVSKVHADSIAPGEP
jgi:hypothetical protein